MNTRESGGLYRGGRRFGLRRRPALEPVRLSSSELSSSELSSSETALAQRRWLLPGALGVLVVGVLAGTVVAVLGLPSGGGATAAPGHAGDTPLPGLVTGASPLPEQPESSVTPSESADASGRQVLPPVGALQTASSQCLDIEKTDNGAWAMAADCGGSDQQRWQLTRTSNDQYLVVNLATGECLDAEKASRDDGARILQWTCHDGNNQHWLVRGDTNTFALINVNSGMCATVEGDGKVRQHPCRAHASQHWSPGPTAPGQSPISSSAT